jgi:hypothetical protein
VSDLIPLFPYSLRIKRPLCVAPHVNESVGMRNMRRTADDQEWWSGLEWKALEWSREGKYSRAREEGCFAFRDDYPLEASPWTSPQLFHQPNHITEINNKSSQPTPTSLLKLSILLLNRHQ